MIMCIFFFFNDTATTEIYTLSLHDALPIFSLSESRRNSALTTLTSNIQLLVCVPCDFLFLLGSTHSSRNACKYNLFSLFLLLLSSQVLSVLKMRTISVLRFAFLISVNACCVKELSNFPVKLVTIDIISPFLVMVQVEFPHFVSVCHHKV